jgi:hypothetical protein
LEPNKKLIYDHLPFNNLHGMLVGVGSLWLNERPMQTHKRFPRFESFVTLLHGKRNNNKTKKIDDPTTMLGEFEVPKP